MSENVVTEMFGVFTLAGADAELSTTALTAVQKQVSLWLGEKQQSNWW